MSSQKFSLEEILALASKKAMPNPNEKGTVTLGLDAAAWILQINEITSHDQAHSAHIRLLSAHPQYNIEVPSHDFDSWLTQQKAEFGDTVTITR